MSDLGPSVLTPFSILAISMPPAVEGVLSFRSSYFWEFRSLVIKCTAGQDRGLQDDSPHWFLCVTGCKIVQQRAERLTAEGNIGIIIWGTG